MQAEAHRFGALVSTSLVHDDSRQEKVDRILHKLRAYSGNDDLHVDGDVVENIAVYLWACSVKVTRCPTTSAERSNTFPEGLM